MTEVVTSTAASPQLNLLAARQQGFSVSAVGLQNPFAGDVTQASFEDAQKAQQISFSSGDSSVNRHDGEGESAGAEQNSPNGSGPSKARVEIKHLDLGLTPSEVVGTPDVLQRFDDNGDGRVDLMEAGRAGLVRQKVFTFAGLAAPARAPVVESEAPPPVAVAAPEAPAQVAAAVAASPQAAVDKSFAPVETGPVPGTKKFADVAEAVAAVGSPDNGVDVPRKFYGQGVEVVAGQFAAAAEAAPKYYDKVGVKDQVAVSEDGSGEVKYYDKVAQSESGQPGGDQAGQDASGAYYEKAQQLANAKKGTLPEVAVYADAAAIEVPAVTVVTA